MSKSNILKICLTAQNVYSFFFSIFGSRVFIFTTMIGLVCRLLRRFQTTGLALESKVKVKYSYNPPKGM